MWNFLRGLVKKSSKILLGCGNLAINQTTDQTALMHVTNDEQVILFMDELVIQSCKILHVSYCRAA